MFDDGEAMFDDKEAMFDDREAMFDDREAMLKSLCGGGGRVGSDALLSHSHVMLGCDNLHLTSVITELQGVP